MRDYRSKHFYREPSSGGFWLLLIGGSIVGAIIPILLGVDFPRASYVGAIVGVIIWIIVALR